MINAGAIAASDLIVGKDFPERVTRLIDMFGRYCGRQVYVNSSVYASERSTGHRNRAMAHLMLNFGMVSPAIEETLDLYFQQCSIMVTAKDLAVVMGATLPMPVSIQSRAKKRSNRSTSKIFSASCTLAACMTSPVNGLTASVFPPRVVSGVGSWPWCRDKLASAFSRQARCEGKQRPRGEGLPRSLHEFGLHVFECNSASSTIISQFDPK